MEIARQVLSVLLVFALLGAALWALRRAGPVSLRGRFLGGARPSEGRAKSLESLERLVLSPQHSLHLIQVDGQQLLVAVHPQGCTLLRVDTTGGTAG